MVLENAAGVKIGGKPTVGKDTKSIEFSGSQLAPFKTSRPFPSLGGKSKISLAFKPADVAPADDGTILRYGTQWELRYSAKLGKLSFIIWDVEKNFTIATVVADAGSWHEAEATFDGSTMRLEVGGQVDEKPVVAAIFVEPREPNLVLGASRPNTTGEAGIDIRPFAGSVADIQISD